MKNTIHSAKKNYCRIAQHPFTKSIVGKILICAVCETVGGSIGGWVGGRIFSWIGSQALRSAPILGVGWTLYQLRSRVSLVAASIFTVPDPWTSIPYAWKLVSGWSADAGCQAGYWLGQKVGTILGGYYGLKKAGSSVHFWNHTVTCDCYSVGMAKFLIAGEIFEQVISSCTIPLISLPFNFIRKISSIAIKAIAFNSNAVFKILKNFVKQKDGIGQDVILPLLVKIFLSRFCQENSVQVTHKLIFAISRPFNIVPAFSNQMKIFLSLISDPFQNAIKSLGSQGDKITTVIMRKFIEYHDLVSGSEDFREAKNEDEWEAALNKVVPLSGISSTILNQIRPRIEEAVGAALSSIQEMEKDLIGTPILNTPEKVRKRLVLQIKYFIPFLLKRNDLTLLTPLEEKRFFLIAAQNYFSLYSEQTASDRLVRLVAGTARFSISSFFFWRMKVSPFFIQREQDSIMVVPLHITDHVKGKPECESKA